MTAEPRSPLPIPDVAPLAVPPGFVDKLAAAGVTIDATALERLGGYLARLLAMNARMNLTAIEDPAAAWDRHVFDALTLLPALAAVPAGATLADIGSGGGVPGIPLAIARPDLSVALVEATQKKAAFLEGVARALGLSNVTVHAERAEALVRGALRHRFDVVTARAVARLDALVPITAPFAKAGGLLLLIKGQKADEELAEAEAALERHRARHVDTIATPTGRIVVLRRLSEGEGVPKD
ncbi:16S rRNA (guanine(527)-N(7))-methyltransferase RsmG, partial [Myxococcota bacterium]|nr:16S rRNA (guanine(527)-N(7))-methyltransferase RsmG [Myxococcota bacterium]